MTVTVFDDWQPEDGYDAGDPIEKRLAVLVRIVDHILEDTDPARRMKRIAKASELASQIEIEFITLADKADELRRRMAR